MDFLEIIEVYEVIRPRGAVAQFAVAAERGRTLYIGRAQELETFERQFRQVKTGRGQVVVITGEAGMGKALLGKVLARCGQYREDERQLHMACQKIEEIAAALRTPPLRQAFLTAAQVQDAYQTLGRKLPERVTPS